MQSLSAFDPELRSIAQEVGDTKIAVQPFHSARPAGSYMAYRVIESIIAFANAEGGLLLLGVAEEREAIKIFQRPMGS